jgi:tyrosyl-tRNA synthetase
MFGKVMSIPDDLMIKYYRLCTALPVGEIDSLEASLAAGTKHPNAAKRRLAREIVAQYHDFEAAQTAEAAFDRIFKHREMPEDIAEARVTRTDPVHLPAIMKEAGLAPTTSEARRLIDGGAVRVDGEALGLAPGVYDVPWSMVQGRVLQAGKRRYARIVG